MPLLLRLKESLKFYRTAILSDSNFIGQQFYRTAILSDSNFIGQQFYRTAILSDSNFIGQQLFVSIKYINLFK